MRNNNASSAEPEPKALLPSARTNHSGKNKYLVPAPSEEPLTVNLKIGSEEIIWKIKATNIVIPTPNEAIGVKKPIMRAKPPITSKNTAPN